MNSTIYGDGGYRYRTIEGWGFGLQGRIPGGYVPGVLTDSQDRVFLLVRAPSPVLVYDREGNFLHSWGEGVFKETHGFCIGIDENIFIADRQDHTVRKFSHDGMLLLTLGVPGNTGDEGEPFNGPTDVAESASGDIYVSDGGNFRIHKFSPDGELLLSWGKTGVGPGEFALAHNVVIDNRDRIIIGDRENNRVQVFDSDGHYQDEWAVPKPNGMFYRSNGEVAIMEEENGKVSIYNDEGELLSHWGEKGSKPGQFHSFPHSLCFDSRGDLYVTELHSDNLVHKFEHV